MTRDTPVVLDERNSKTTDDDVYAALWEAASFPRLPIDAPDQLKSLTIDIDDPKRVYTIYRAGRRHNLQNLIERFGLPNCLETL